MSTPGSSIRYFSSNFNPICNLPEVSTWSFIFDDKATNIADKKIYVDASTGESLTRSELQSIARSFAYVLTHTMDLKQGDTLLLIASNSLFFPAVVLATQAAAVICSPANALSTSSELVYQITDSGAKL
ncbi:hypothetical protein BT96DRAFT_982631 [Gymnopus androsaceus JB14]|uniref:AMP-dependent synthetase/ligase domain-containing protein n=1 Tax=Gymnopus androsaceus JB14 TaxID=1447944 RepID=A0A6A4GCW6_9AGAR|nr:hypothetical protein BT96DRAFT_982631 [Gymnopus androsaceus JB14]